MSNVDQMAKQAIENTQMFIQSYSGLNPETQKSVIGYMLVSQIEAVQAVLNVENKVGSLANNPSELFLPLFQTFSSSCLIQDEGSGREGELL